MKVSCNDLLSNLEKSKVNQSDSVFSSFQSANAQFFRPAGQEGYHSLQQSALHQG